MTRHYCTYFDKNYLDKGVSLYLSLRAHCRDAVLHVCCLDNASFEILTALALDGVSPVRLVDVERADPAFATVRSTRSRIEYYFTLTPAWLTFVFDREPSIEVLTYVDSDLCFFSDPEPLHEELRAAGGAVGIIAHRFPPRLAHLAFAGLYNVGWVTFTRTRDGQACLADWRAKCIDWCFDRLEDGRYGDQKYLDSWQADHSNVVVLQHPGANVALWNLDCATVSDEGDVIRIEGEPLLFFHFHGLRQIAPRLFFTNAQRYALDLNRLVRRRIYGPYLATLRAVQTSLGLRSRSIRKMPFNRSDVQLAVRKPLNGNFLISVRPVPRLPLASPERSARDPI